MSKKDDIFVETAEEEMTAAEETSAPAEETAAAETSEAAETTVEETAETAADDAEYDFDSCDECDAEGKHLFAALSNIVKKLKAKYAKCPCSDTDDVDEDDVIDIENDDIVLDDDIIAELKEQERREQLRKKIICIAACTATVLFIISLIRKSKKKGCKDCDD